MKKLFISITLFSLIFGTYAESLFAKDEPIKLLLVTGRSNKYHSWQGTSTAFYNHLMDAGIFEVEKIVTTPTGESLGDFAPKWSDYQAVLLDYEGEEWSESTKASFVEYMKNGGGLIVVHGGNNAFPYWPEYNDMIAIGGWGGASLHEPPLYPNNPEKHPRRDEKWGPRVYWEGCGMVHDDSPGGANHPKPHDFIMTVRTPDHPIMRGLPEMWLHPNDEVYSDLRGPAKNMTILATGFANPDLKGASPHNEPMLFTVSYGKGRVFHSTLGHIGASQDHTVPAVNAVDFIITLQRGAEWAATGKVTLPVPEDFPTAYRTSVREVSAGN